VLARVVGLDRGRFLTRLEPPAAPAAVTAMLARELGHRAVVVGDLVGLVGDVTGAKDTLARLVRVEPRTTELRRATDQGRGRDRLMVANADQMALVVALADPPPRPGLIDRALVAAYAGALTPLIVATKADLADARELAALYGPLGVDVLVTGREPGTRRLYGLEAVRDALSGRSSVLVGHSGVGKSTLVNALVSHADRATGAVNEVTGRGRHTSSSTAAFALPGGGLLIDTPGVRSFGLSHVDPDRILAAFPDLAEVAQLDCPRGCQHGPKAVDCALEEWAEASPAHHARVASFHRLIATDHPERT
jgi:ribosome biogenesis GTPase